MMFHVLLDSKALSLGRFPCLHCTTPSGSGGGGGVNIAIYVAGDSDPYIAMFVSPSFVVLSFSFHL